MGIPFNPSKNKGFKSESVISQDSVADTKFNPEFIKYLLDRTESDDIVINKMLIDELHQLSIEKLKQGLSFVVYHNGIEYRQVRIGNKNEGNLIWPQHLENLKVAIAKTNGNVIRVDTFIEILNESIGVYDHDMIGLITDRAFRMDFGVYVKPKNDNNAKFQYNQQLSYVVEPLLRNFILDTAMLYKSSNLN